MDVIYYGFDNYKNPALPHNAAHPKTATQDIALLTGSSRHFFESECISGFQDAMETAGISIDENRILTSDTTTKEGAFSAFLHSWVNTPRRPSSPPPRRSVRSHRGLQSDHEPHSPGYLHHYPGRGKLEPFLLLSDIIRTSRPAYSWARKAAKALIEAH